MKEWLVQVPTHPKSADDERKVFYHKQWLRFLPEIAHMRRMARAVQEQQPTTLFQIKDKK